MGKPGSNPNPSPTVRSIVRYGLSFDDRHALVNGNKTIIRALVRAGYDAKTIDECIAYAQQMCGAGKAA